MIIGVLIMNNKEHISRAISDCAKQIYEQNVKVGWWEDLKAIDQVAQNPELKRQLDIIFKKDFVEYLKNILKCQKLALIHSEISEALEGLRRNLKDDHLPEYDMLAVELGDAIIRILDLGAACGYPMGKIVTEKIEYNAQRSDHKKENRDRLHGKQF